MGELFERKTELLYGLELLCPFQVSLPDVVVEAYRRQKAEFITKVRPIIDEIKSSGVTTLTEIALCLTRRGIPTRTGKSVWFPSTVKTVVG